MVNSGDGFVLVVEDDDDLRGALCESLKFEGVMCELARSGWEALELLRSGLRPRAILLDLKMAGMDGVEFLRKRRGEEEAIRDLPVIVLTGDRRGTVAEELGARLVITKPANVDTLLRALRPFLGGADGK